MTATADGRIGAAASPALTISTSGLRRASANAAAI